MPTLKESLYRKLFSQSGQCLSICNRELSYINLHKKYLRGTPKLFPLYETAVNYYETMTEHDHALETPDIRVNTLSDCRNVMLTFVRTNIVQSWPQSFVKPFTRNLKMYSKELYFTNQESI